jgi:hypothetical protein
MQPWLLPLLLLLLLLLLLSALIFQLLLLCCFRSQLFSAPHCFKACISRLLPR